MLQSEFAHGIDNEILERIQPWEKNLVELDDFLTRAGLSKEIGSRVVGSRLIRFTLKIMGELSLHSD